MNRKIFIFGFGYTSAYFTKLVTEQQCNVVSTSRNKLDKYDYLKKLNINDNYVKILDYNNDNISKELIESDYILVSIAPTAQGIDPVINDYKDIIIENKSHIKWLGYLSSTGVYGDHHGEWVDENSKCLTKSPTSINRLNAEIAWLDLFKSNNIPVHIFRLAGIYGPGHSVIERLISGKDYSVYKKDQLFSRIHVEDIANILYASMNNITPGEVYNVCDDMPAASHEVDAFAAKLLDINKLKIINYTEAKLSPMAMEFYSSNKRVSNKKMKARFNYAFIFPNYRVGLTRILERIREN